MNRIKVIKFVIVDLLQRKPYCCGTKTFSKLGDSLGLIILENILERVEIIDVGR